MNEKNVLKCEICGKSIPTCFDRCTNSRCMKCHSEYCTPGGSTSPGHGRKWPSTTGNR